MPRYLYHPTQDNRGPLAVYDLHFYVDAAMSNAQTIARVKVPRRIFIPAGLPETLVDAATAATADTILSLQKNAVEFGTITIHPDGTATLAAAADTTFNVGDVLSVVGPALADATLAALAIVLVGYLWNGT